MEIQVDGDPVFSMAQWELDVIANDIPLSALDADLKRRLEWVLKHKVEQCYIRFEKEWMEKLRADPEVRSIPIDKAEFVAMVKARPDYKDRAAKDAEAALQLGE